MEDSGNSEKKGSIVVSDQASELEVVTSILSKLSGVDRAARERIIETVATFYGIGLRGKGQTAYEALPLSVGKAPTVTAFSEDRSISPKQFMLEKQPMTDVEKVACLAYYLTHYRSMAHFKTLDISKLNTEAAQIKLSNATVAVDNAAKRNYLVPASKGNKQISALGEQFVQALPDREKARAIMAAGRPRKKTRKAGDEDDAS